MSERLHPVTFVLSPALQLPADPLPSLHQFVADVGYSFRDTNRVLILNNDDPWHYGGLDGMLGSHVYPTESFGVAVIIGHSAYTSNGWTRVAPNGDAVVLFDTARIYETGDPAGNGDYWQQVHKATHELSHNFGVVSEPYKNYQDNDLTGVHPIVPVNANNPDDVLWSRHADWSDDPMLHSTGRTFSNHNKRIISGSYRIGHQLPPLAPLDQCSIAVVDSNDAPLPGARVRVWSVHERTSEPTLLADAFSSADGRVQFTWHSNPRSNDAVLWKCHYAGCVPQAGWLVLLDLESAGMDGIPLAAIARMSPQAIGLEAIQAVPGLLKLSGLLKGQRLDIFAGPIAGPTLVVDRVTATGDVLFWQDPLPTTDATRAYHVKVVSDEESGAKRLCRMCGVV